MKIINRKQAEDKYIEICTKANGKYSGKNKEVFKQVMIFLDGSSGRIEDVMDEGLEILEEMLQDGVNNQDSYDAYRDISALVSSLRTV